MRGELLSKMHPGFDDLENSQTVQIAKDTTFRILIVWKVSSIEKAKGVAGQPFASSKEMLCDSWIPSTISEEVRNRDGIIHEKFEEDLLV